MSSEINFQNNEFSHQYDALANQVVPGYRVACELLEAQMDVLLPTNAQILVVGSGTGDEIFKLSTRHPSWVLTGVDSSAEMLEIASEKIKQQNVQNTITFVQHDITEINFNESYDAAICRLTLSHLPNMDAKKKSLQAIFNALSPNGYLSIIDYFSNADLALHNFERECWQARAVYEGCTKESSEELITYADKKMNQISPEALLSLCEQVGFTAPYQFFQANNTRGYLFKKEEEYDKQ